MATNTTRRKEVNLLLPEDGIATRQWLMQQGFSRHAIDNLVKSEQIATIAPGVYTRWGTKPSWQGFVFFIQDSLGSNLTVGGLSALDLLGLSQYLPLATQKNIHLYGTARLPLWSNKAITDVRFIWHSEWDLLGRRRPTELNQGDPLKRFTRLQPWKEGKADLVLSSPERALLEILADVPDDISFEHADQLMQGMTSLSPSLLQTLLQECRNVKVRRLFFLLADHHQHAWLKKMAPEKIDLGSGKRQLVENGKLDKKYLITIPKTYES